jgi:hypothetical protein
MKKNVVLKSSDRELFGIRIRQNTKEKFLSLTDLQRAYEKARWIYGWSDKRINDILSSIATKERVFYILQERDLIKAEISVFMEMVDKEGLTKVLKGLDLYKTTGRGSDNTVMCDPYIWVLLALELNPMIYAKVVMYLTDSLIFDRVEAGTEYMPMNSAIKKVVDNPDYAKYAKMINNKVFGQHITGMRNLANAKELRKIADIEKFIINAVNQNWLRSELDLCNAIENYK